MMYHSRTRVDVGCFKKGINSMGVNGLKILEGDWSGKMYISKLRIQNFRCFDDVEIEFNEGLNVIIGENNCGLDVSTFPRSDSSIFTYAFRLSSGPVCFILPLIV